MEYKNISYGKIRIFNGKESIVVNPNETFDSEVKINDSKFEEVKVAEKPKKVNKKILQEEK